MNFTGIMVALFTLLAIGLGFLWVIKLEYYVGAHIARAVLAAGFGLVVVSLFLPNFWSSALLGIIGGTVIWGSTELPDQAERVTKGQFPANPRKQPAHKAKES